MKLTPHQSQYFAHELTRRFSADQAEKLTSILVDAQIHINPHQIEAALFAFRSPLSKGALLADEVGLGKTIEAGLVLAQRWAERKRRILVITPSNLRKQWYQEITEKFGLPCSILESKSYKEAERRGNLRPFDSTNIVICSYQFAKSRENDVRHQVWDLVVIDEAHRLRNVYKPSNKIANTLKSVLAGKDKLLLTATPLQNSLLELYGLISFIDEHVFGDIKSFREQFANLNQQQAFDTLKERLKPICYRTLRRQVMPYVKYTKRQSIVQEFTPEPEEDELYRLVSEYLRRDNLYALPKGQRILITLVMRKLLASSTFAIAGSIDSLLKRLGYMAESHRDLKGDSLEEDLDIEYEAFDEILEEWDEPDIEEEGLEEDDLLAIVREIEELLSFKKLALSIDQNAKGKALLIALDRAFKEAERLGAAKKAIIFTESRRTQLYIQRLLADSDFSEGIVLFNGTNTDERSKEIYKAWVKEYADTDRLTGSKTADMRSALVDYFRDQGHIMIATEAGAEGINLQFCSLVVNYDLPWNPQRVEQRIGRCHRYGQQHDVVVVNFLNRSNEADQRVFELLSEKFKLFEGVFGASDEILGAIESGIDFEKRIADIYQNCRHPSEIQTAFDTLRQELDLEISEAMTRTRQQLLENFDDEVREKLRIQDEKSKAYLSRFEQMLMNLSQYELRNHATFLDESSFDLHTSPVSQDIPTGLYELPRRSGNAHLYRLSHPLAQSLIAQAQAHVLPVTEIEFDYGAHEGRVSVLEPLQGQTGWLTLTRFSIEALDQREDHLVFSALTDQGNPLAPDTASRLLTLPGRDTAGEISEQPPATLHEILQQQQARIRKETAERNARFFEQEAKKLDDWADDLKVALEREIRELDRQIKEARRAASLGLTLEEKLHGQRIVRDLETQRNQKRRSLFEAQDEVDRQRNDLIEQIEAKLQMKEETKTLFTIRWRLI
ncbi:MAG: SNF2-related protein [Bacteroidia bacterium]|nr:SNF2-related protein [Bacteroidia bacterium]